MESEPASHLGAICGCERNQKGKKSAQSSEKNNRSDKPVGWSNVVAKNVEEPFEGPLRMLKEERDRLVQERKVFEDLFNESERRNRILGVQLMRVADDLHAVRRIMPITAREIKFSRVNDWTIMKEKAILSYLVREDAEKTMVEIQSDRTVKLTVIIKDMDVMKSCVLVSTKLRDYKC